MEAKEVFDIFYEICQIPRPSKHEERISQWLVDFAAKHGIACYRDKALNVILRVPATPGYESHPGLILQAHMDMVCEKNADCAHDFMADPIRTYIDGDWLKAEGTTLGADDGIGMAMALAALTSPTLKHPAMEVLVTVDEETGLSGADALEDGVLQGSRLINLDNEDDGCICIGCAGGIDTLAKMHYTPTTPDAREPLFAARIRVSGLVGGHSGEDINKGRANANKLIVRFLFPLLGKGLQLASINGGNLRNAIARECEAVILVPYSYKEQLRIDWNIYQSDIEAEYAGVEPEMHFELESCDMPQAIIPTAQADRLIRALYACPHGVDSMCRDIEGLVETSTNLASVKMRDGYVEINTSQRSSVESRKHDLKRRVEAILSLACDEVTHGDGYPGWTPNVKSDLLDIIVACHERLFGRQPQVMAIHAGLECGLFLTKYPTLDMVSVGPQMYGVHSPQERLSIASTEKTWTWLYNTIEAC